LAAVVASAEQQALPLVGAGALPPRIIHDEMGDRWRGFAVGADGDLSETVRQDLSSESGPRGGALAPGALPPLGAGALPRDVHDEMGDRLRGGAVGVDGDLSETVRQDLSSESGPRGGAPEALPPLGAGALLRDVHDEMSDPLLGDAVGVDGDLVKTVRQDLALDVPQRRKSSGWPSPPQPRQKPTSEGRPRPGSASAPRRRYRGAP